MLRHGFNFAAESASGHSRALCAFVMVSSVVKVLEEMMNRVSAGSRSRRLHEIGAIHVRHEAEGQAALAVMFERLVSHHRTKIGTADTDIDDVLDAFAGMAFPFAAADAIGKLRHLVEHGVDFRHHIFSVHENGFTFRRAQSDVQHGAVFRDVDLCAAEHRVHFPAQAGFPGQLQEQLERLVGDEFLEKSRTSSGFGSESLAAFGVFSEQFSQGQFLDLCVMRGEGFPSRALGEWFDRCFHICDSSFRA